MRYLMQRALILLLAALLAGCGEDESPAEASPSANKRGPIADTSGSSGLTIRLLPEHPTVRDDLRMMVSGAGGSIHCRWERNGEEISPEDSNCLPEGNFRKGDRIEVSLTSGEETAKFAVTVGNTPPEVVRVSLADPEIHQGKEIRVNPEGSDVDGDPVSFRYRWEVNGVEQSFADGPALPAGNFVKGDRVGLTVIPFDGEAEGEPYRGKEFTIPNAPPRFVSQPPRQFRSEIYSYHARAEDPDGESLSYRLEQAPDAMEIDPATGSITWPVAQADAGSHTVRIVVEDEEGMRAVQEYSVDIAITSGD